METNKIYLGDCLELIKQIPSGSVDLILTDPPYFKDMKVGGDEHIKKPPIARQRLRERERENALAIREKDTCKLKERGKN